MEAAGADRGGGVTAVRQNQRRKQRREEGGEEGGHRGRGTVSPELHGCGCNGGAPERPYRGGVEFSGGGGEFSSGGGESC
jgi:hypothetical protein